MTYVTCRKYNNLLVTILFLFQIIIHHRSDADEVIKEARMTSVDVGVKNKGAIPSAGFRVRLTQNAFDYLNKVFDDLLTDVLPGASLPDISVNFTGGTLKLTQIVIDDYKSPDSYQTQLQPPNKIVWTMKNMNIGLKGQFHITGIAAGSGTFSGKVQGVGLTFKITLTSQHQLLHVSADDCQATVQNVDLTIQSDNQALTDLFNLNKFMLVQMAKPQLQSEICKRLRSIVQNDLNARLSENGHMVPLSRGPQSMINASADSSIGSGGNSSLVVQRATRAPDVKKLLDSLYLDYGLLQDPLVTKQYMDVLGSGEISYMGQDNTPIKPGPLADPGSSDRMIYAQVGDYVLNSMFYHAYKNQLLDFLLNSTYYPNLTQPLSAGPCGPDQCVGSLFPELQSLYPNGQTQIRARALSQPTYSTSPGTVNLGLKALLTLLAPDGQKELLKTNLTLNGVLGVFTENDRIKGNLSIQTLTLDLVSSSLPSVTQTRLNSLGVRAKNTLQLGGNLALRQGVPVPVGKGVKLVRPTFKAINQYVQVETDVVADRVFLAQQVKRRMKDSAARGIAVSP